MDGKEVMIWKDIPNFEGYYQISNTGAIKSIPHVVSKGTRFEHISKEHNIKAHLNRCGYLQVRLCKNGVLSSHSVHRLVALAFVPNPFDLPEINHKDENKLNNHPSNLEWCTKAYNTRYGTRTQRTSKRVLQMTLDGKAINLFNSIKEASRMTGVAPSNIRNCASGRIVHSKGKGDYVTRTASGYKWAYADTH